ncbi:MAG: hypothetical protein QXU92_00540 [Candidatus Diapherotrites archaeon]
MKKIFFLFGFLILFGFAHASLSFNSISDIRVSENSTAEKVLDLRNYLVSENLNNVVFNVVSQSNPSLVDCYIVDNYFVSCSKALQNNGKSRIRVSASSPFESVYADFYAFVSNESKISELSSSLIVEVEKQEIRLKPGERASILVKITNKGLEKTCFELGVNKPVLIEKFIDFSFTKSNYCISANESLEISLEVMAHEDAYSSNYYFNVYVKSSSTFLEKTVKLSISEYQSPLEIKLISGKQLCLEPYSQTLEFEAINKSNNKEFAVYAYNDLLLPEPSGKILNLYPNSKTNFELKLNTNKDFLGKHEIIFRTDSDVRQIASFEVELIECDSKDFSIEVYPLQNEIRAGQTLNFTINIFNKSKKTQEINLSSDGTLPNKLTHSKVEIEKDGMRRVNLSVSARPTDNKGTHFITLYVWNENQSEIKNIRVSVLPKRLLEVNVLNNSFEARVCSADKGQVFEILVKNLGDFEEKINLKVLNEVQNVQVLIPEKNFVLAPSKSKSVFVFVNPSIEASPGDYVLPIEVSSNSFSERIDLKFKIVSSVEADGFPTLVSFPSEIELKAGSSKEIRLTLKNNSYMPAENLIISFSSDQISAENLKIREILPNKTLQVSTEIKALDNAKPGSYNLRIDLKKGDKVVSKNVLLKILPQKSVETEKNDKLPFSGLFTLGNFFLAGAFLFFLLLVLLLFFVLRKDNLTKVKVIEG